MIYDGYDLSGLLVVEEICRQLLPQIDAHVETFDNLDGGKAGLSTLGVGQISVKVRMFAVRQGFREQAEGLESRRRQVAQRLMRREPCKLILHDAPDVYYMAKLDGTTDLEKLAYTTSTTLTFICPEAAGHGRRCSKTFADRCTINVGGNFPTAPVFTVTTEKFVSAIAVDDQLLRTEKLFAGPEPFVFDCADELTTRGNFIVPVNVEDDYPIFHPGEHEVRCEEDSECTVEWTERWL